jgi:hypothetical protein
MARSAEDLIEKASSMIRLAGIMANVLIAQGTENIQRK